MSGGAPDHTRTIGRWLASLQSLLQSGVLVLCYEVRPIMPGPKSSQVVKRAVTLRLPEDLLALVEDEAIADGRERRSGRVYSPSATIERILREYFDGRPRRRTRSK